MKREQTHNRNSRTIARRSRRLCSAVAAAATARRLLRRVACWRLAKPSLRWRGMSLEAFTARCGEGVGCTLWLVYALHSIATSNLRLVWLALLLVAIVLPDLPACTQPGYACNHGDGSQFGCTVVAFVNASEGGLVPASVCTSFLEPGYADVIPCGAVGEHAYSSVMCTPGPLYTAILAMAIMALATEWLAVLFIPMASPMAASTSSLESWSMALRETPWLLIASLLFPKMLCLAYAKLDRTPQLLRILLGVLRDIPFAFATLGMALMNSSGLHVLLAVVSLSAAVTKCCFAYGGHLINHFKGESSKYTSF